MPFETSDRKWMIFLSHSCRLTSISWRTLHSRNLVDFSGGVASVFTESVVATAKDLRSPSLPGHKTMRFSDTYGSFQGLPKAKRPSQLTQDQPLNQQFVTPSLVVMREFQEMEELTRFIAN